MERLGKNFWCLWGGFTVSTTGSYISLIVVNLFIYQVTGSALLVGTFFLLRLIPAFFMGNIAGVLADKYDRKYLIVLADVVRAALIFSMIFVKDDIFPLYFLIFGISICDRLYFSCIGGSLPNIAGASALVKANAYLASGRTIALVAGPMLGGVLTSFGRYDVAFSVDAATYLFSASMVLLITARFQGASAARKALGIWKGFKEGYGFILARAGLVGVILIRALDAFGSSAINVGTPIFASTFSQPAPGVCYGLMYAAYGVGEMVGSLVLARRPFVQQRAPEQVVGVSILFMALFFGIAFTVPFLAVTLAGMVLSGVAEGVTAVTYNIYLQRNPDEVRGRIVGTSETTVWTVMGIGMFLSGLLAERIAIGTVVQAFAALIVAGCLVYLGLWRRRMSATSPAATLSPAAAPAATT